MAYKLIRFDEVLTKTSWVTLYIHLQLLDFLGSFGLVFGEQKQI